MSDHEILKVATFQVHACAGYVQKLARQARRSATGDRLTATAAAVLELEIALRSLAERPTDAGGDRTP